MTDMIDIINELNLENGSNYKKAVLEKHRSDPLLQKLLKLTYDKVEYTFGISMKKINYTPERNYSFSRYSLEYALKDLEDDFVSRTYTGNEAVSELTSMFENLSKDDAKVLEGVINRDLRINLGRSNINKVFKGLITKPLYMRCDTYSVDKPDLDDDGVQKVNKKNELKIIKGTDRNINFENKAIIQKKADGTFREFHVAGTVKANSRSGEEYHYPNLFEEMKDYRIGTYHGEITVRLDAALLAKILPKLEKIDKKNGTTDATELVERFKNEGEFILPRSIGNGLVNSSDIPHENLVLDLWDFITPEEYSIAGKKDKKNPCTIPYEERFEMLINIVPGYAKRNINIIESHEVETLEEALKIVSVWMQDGFEGGVLKDKSGVFKDGTSQHQLKLKLEVECDMRITGFTKGNNKNADYFGAVTFENDDQSIMGKVGVSSMSEVLRDWFHENREYLIGKIMEVQFNDFSKARGNKHKALSHPRFIELREEKDTPDTLERVQKNIDMAMQLKKRIK